MGYNNQEGPWAFWGPYSLEPFGPINLEAEGRLNRGLGVSPHGPFWGLIFLIIVSSYGILLRPQLVSCVAWLLTCCMDRYLLGSCIGPNLPSTVHVSTCKNSMGPIFCLNREI